MMGFERMVQQQLDSWSFSLDPDMIPFGTNWTSLPSQVDAGLHSNHCHMLGAILSTNASFHATTRF